MKTLAVETGALVTFGITPAGTGGNRQVWLEELDILDRTATGGGRMIGQTHSRDIARLLSFRTALPFDKLPGWKELRSQPIERQEEMLRDPALQVMLIHAAHHETYPRFIGAEPRKPVWDLIRVYTGPLPPYPTLAHLSETQGRDPVQIMVDLALAKPGLDQFFIQNSARSTDDNLLEIMRHPRTVMTFSDSGAHVSQICDCSIHTHLLGYWVREREAFTFEEAVRMITLVPALTWGFSDRGLLREGLVADVNVIDPAAIAPLPPRVVYDLPGGCRRLVQDAVGIRATVVNGQLLLDNARHTGALPGKLLRQAGR